MVKHLPRNKRTSVNSSASDHLSASDKKSSVEEQGGKENTFETHLSRSERSALKKNPFARMHIDEKDQYAAEALAAERAFNKKVSVGAKLGIVAFFLVAFFGSFMLGRYSISPVEWFQGVTDHIMINFDAAWPFDPRLDAALFNLRFPRICVVLLVGAALAVAGASYQGMFKNPLVSPDILGASAGASLGACLALLLDMPNYMVQILAFCGGMLAVGLAVWFNRFVKYDPILGLVLGGILVSTLFQSGTSIVKFLADADDKLPSITFWLMGSFAGADIKQLKAILIPMVGGFVLLLLESWKLNVLSFGDEEARSMGINTKRTRFVVIFASTLIVSCSVAIAGIVGWIGLVVPHLARALVGPNYRVLLPTSMIVGSAFLLVVDDIARLVLSVELPIGILTSILGVPFFIFIFRHNMRGWS